MNALPLLALATGLHLTALPASAANTQAAEARLDTLVTTAAPALAARGLDAAQAKALHQYARASATEIAASRPADPAAIRADAAGKTDPSQGFDHAAHQRIGSLVSAAAPRLCKHAVAGGLAVGTARIGHGMNTAMAAMQPELRNDGEVAVVAPRAESGTPVHKSAP